MGWICDDWQPKNGNGTRKALLTAPDGRTIFHLRIWRIMPYWYGCVFDGPRLTNHRLCDPVRCDTEVEAKQAAESEARKLYAMFGGKQ